MNSRSAKPLEEVCDFKRGLTYSKSDEVASSSNVVLRATNINLSTNLLDFTELKYLDDQLVIPKTKMIAVGSLLICTASGSKSHLGKVAFIDQDYGYAFGGFMGMLTPKSSLSGKYLYYLMISDAYKEFIGKLSDGVNINNLKFEDIKLFPVPLPTLPEQRRIVAILDEAFAGLDAMRANAEKNLQNARALFDSHLNAVFSEKGEGWVERTLGEVADFKNGLNFTQSSKGEVIRIVGVKDFKNYLWVPMTGLETVQIEGALSPAYELQENDILTVRSNGNKQLIGRCILAGAVEGKVSHSGFTIRIRLKSKEIEPKYLVRYLKSAAIRSSLIESGDGANISSLNQRALTALPVFFPKRDLQHEIVARLEALELESERLGSIYRQKLAAIAELKQSILQKAFAGELTSSESVAA